jgi:hypothetical protein
MLHFPLPIAVRIKRTNCHLPVDLRCKNQQSPLSSHFVLKMEAVSTYETLAVQPTSSRCHHPDAGSELFHIPEVSSAIFGPSIV